MRTLSEIARVFPTFEFVDGILKRGHSNKRYLAVVSCDTGIQCQVGRIAGRCFPHTYSRRFVCLIQTTANKGKVAPFSNLRDAVS